MEFIHGAIRSKNKNACFFIRKPESLEQIPSKYQDKFFDKEELPKAHLKVIHLLIHFRNMFYELLNINRKLK
jgi:hypothetical protein